MKRSDAYLIASAAMAAPHLPVWLALTYAIALYVMRLFETD